MNFVSHVSNSQIKAITLCKGLSPSKEIINCHFSTALGDISMFTLNGDKIRHKEGFYILKDYIILNPEKDLHLSIAYFNEYFCDREFNLLKLLTNRNANSLTQDEIYEDIKELEKVIYWIANNTTSTNSCDDEEFISTAEKHEDFSLEWKDYVNGIKQIYMILSWLCLQDTNDNSQNNYLIIS